MDASPHGVRNDGRPESAQSGQANMFADLPLQEGASTAQYELRVLFDERELAAGEIDLSSQIIFNGVTVLSFGEAAHANSATGGPLD